MNPELQTSDEWLAGLKLPALEDISNFRLHRDDWLIVCGGFEDRAIGVLANAVSHGERFSVLLVSYEPFIAENKAPMIRELCREQDLHVDEVIYDRQEPAGFGDILSERLAACRGRIYLDVSGMSRLLIVQSLVALGARPKGFADCCVVYSEAKSYPPARAEAEAELGRSESDPSFSILFLSSGVFEVTLLPELSSPSALGAQTRLIAFPCLDAHQLTALRNEIQPSRLSVIEGEPPSAENKWRRETISRINRLHEIVKVESLVASTLNYAETLAFLLQIYQLHSLGERLVIAPTGSKMQTVAVGIFRAIVRDVQIAYPTPDRFCSPKHYTSGVGRLHQLSLAPFSARAMGGKRIASCA